MEPSAREEEDRLVLRMGQLGYSLVSISSHSSLIAVHYLSYRLRFHSPTRLFNQFLLSQSEFNIPYSLFALYSHHTLLGLYHHHITIDNPTSVISLNLNDPDSESDSWTFPRTRLDSLSCTLLYELTITFTARLALILSIAIADLDFIVISWNCTSRFHAL